MLPLYLSEFNSTLEQFNDKYPRYEWTNQFKSDLINDFVFFSSRIEDEDIVYGDTIRFFNNELVRTGKFKSLLEVSNHKDILTSLIDHYSDFELTEELIKSIHKNLMANSDVWDNEFKPHLVGEYRNIPAIGFREPFFENKEYVPHYNLDIVMASHIHIFKDKLDEIDNTNESTHLLTQLAYFHNKFLNKIHPFADGNGRVCRIIMGIVMMKNNCPPVFTRITSNDDRIDYISTIVECEKINDDKLLIEYLANGLSEYMKTKL